MAQRQILYKSRLVESFGRDDLEDVLSVSRRNNAEVGVTGILIIEDRVAIQVVEGSDEVLPILYETIRADPRHGEVETLLYRNVSVRQFGEWNMVHVHNASDLDETERPAEWIDDMAERVKRSPQTLDIDWAR